MLSETAVKRLTFTGNRVFALRILVRALHIYCLRLPLRWVPYSVVEYMPAPSIYWNIQPKKCLWKALLYSHCLVTEISVNYHVAVDTTLAAHEKLDL